MLLACQQDNTLDVDISDDNCETPLSLSLWTEQFTISQKLLRSGAHVEGTNNNAAHVEGTNSNAVSLLYQAIIREQSKAALFLLENGADYRKR